MPRDERIFEDMKRIFIRLKELEDGEEIRGRDLYDCIESVKRDKSMRLLNCIDKLCELGFTIAENEYHTRPVNPVVKYSLLPSIDNNILFRKHFMS